MTKAKEVMTPNPATCQEKDPIVRAVEIMKREDTGVVPIVDQNNRPVGILTDRDIALDVVLQGLEPQTVPVCRIMHKDLLSGGPEDDMNQLVEQMKRKQVKRILIVDNDRCLGIISEADIVRSQGPQKAGELAGAVYQ